MKDQQFVLLLHILLSPKNEVLGKASPNSMSKIYRIEVKNYPQKNRKQKQTKQIAHLQRTGGFLPCSPYKHIYPVLRVQSIAGPATNPGSRYRNKINLNRIVYSENARKFL